MSDLPRDWIYRVSGMGAVSASGDSQDQCESGLRLPDFVSININAGIPWIGITGAWAIDRYGKMYWGAGPNVGKSATIVSGSAAIGWLNQSCKPTDNDLSNFLSGHAFNVGGGYWAGGGLTYSPSTRGTATNVGVYSPQVGAGYTYSWEKGNAGSSR